ncbi:Alpha/Beta hydrolase protein [Suillus subalutaceus]|uniref:Alpha/Beta hydrolase protein n=1 Tax=Suillus subalutaceus TaxID=48586 RepID=UPI001B882F00|nr:Alpha/Beta hydrolase protein [Suillus subalutaceus]KAG1848728.1 Alpha/Beta hydrolase protein [Suillus subalutaceus]
MSPTRKLTALRAKLQLATFPDELENAQWKFGSPLADIKRLTERWKKRAINEELPMFTRDIDKSETVDAIPLLFCHGWPGSFFEVIKILPLLTASTAEHPSFHVVALSLPGFSFSEAPHKQGFAHKLMVALGYNEYVTQGGDWGGIITRKMASTYGGRHLKAWHTNIPIPEPPSWKSPLSFLSFLLTPWSIEEKAGIERTKWFRTQGQGYYTQQSTQPQTLGYSLTDSPVGLLAWIYEKLVLWTDNYYWSDDEVLTWISLYWFSRAGPAASLRIYFELRADTEDMGRNPTIPMGASFFPKELIVLPAAWLRKSNNVVFESHHKTGGHFAATERPEELVRDVRKMFAKGSPAFGIVPGRTGYDSHVQQ